MYVNLHVLREYFSKLDLEPEIADMYLALYASGPQSISELARNSGVERTRIYRLLDDLKNTGLVEVEVHYKKNIFKAAPISNLQILVSKKEQEARDLRKQLGQLQDELAANSLDSPATRVQFYQGEEGVKQMLWNQTKSKTENLSILYENMQSKTKAAFFERWVRKCNENNIQFRGIIGDHFIETQKQWYSANVNERLASWTSAYVPNDVFTIDHSTIIYDDIVAYYCWKDGEIFGIEIHNRQIAAAQRAFFEMLWSQGQEVDDLKGPSKT